MFGASPILDVFTPQSEKSEITRTVASATEALHPSSSTQFASRNSVQTIEGHLAYRSVNTFLSCSRHSFTGFIGTSIRSASGLIHPFASPLVVKGLEARTPLSPQRRRPASRACATLRGSRDLAKALLLPSTMPSPIRHIGSGSLSAKNAPCLPSEAHWGRRP